jgi:hypothetical protein
MTKLPTRETVAQTIERCAKVAESMWTDGSYCKTAAKKSAGWGGERADLRGADLRGVDLSKVDLREAALSKANLYGANLRGADLRGADLSKANLSEANLSDAILRGANLSEADLYGANLYGADLRGTDMDFSCLPLQCTGLGATVDERLARQFMYHALHYALSVDAPGITQELIDWTNKFHRVGEVPKLELKPEGE